MLNESRHSIAFRSESLSVTQGFLWGIDSLSPSFGQNINDDLGKVKCKLSVAAVISYHSLVTILPSVGRAFWFPAGLRWILSGTFLVFEMCYQSNTTTLSLPLGSWMNHRIIYDSIISQ